MYFRKQSLVLFLKKLILKILNMVNKNYKSDQNFWKYLRRRLFSVKLQNRLRHNSLQGFCVLARNTYFRGHFSLNYSLVYFSLFFQWLHTNHIKVIICLQVPQFTNMSGKLHMGHNIQEWTKWNLRKTVFKKFEGRGYSLLKQTVSLQIPSYLLISNKDKTK